MEEPWGVRLPKLTSPASVRLNSGTATVNPLWRPATRSPSMMPATSLAARTFSLMTAKRGCCTPLISTPTTVGCYQDRQRGPVRMLSSVSRRTPTLTTSHAQRSKNSSPRQRGRRCGRVARSLSPPLPSAGRRNSSWSVRQTTSSVTSMEWGLRCFLCSESIPTSFVMPTPSIGRRGTPARSPAVMASESGSPTRTPLSSQRAGCSPAGRR